MSVEGPVFEVVTRSGGLELRRYQPYVTAKVRVESDGYQEATYAGFRPLANYIFGDNHESGSIEMTAPVSATRPGAKIEMTVPVSASRPGTKIEMTAPVSATKEQGTKIAMTAPVTSEMERTERLGDAPPVCTIRCPGAYEVTFTMPSQYTSVDELPQPNDSRVKLEDVPEHLAAAKRFGGRLDDADVAEATAELQQWIAAQGLSPVGEPVVAQYDAPWIPGFFRHNEVLIPVEKRA